MASLEATIKEDRQRGTELLMEDIYSGRFETLSKQEQFEVTSNYLRENAEQTSLSFKDEVLQHETAVSYLKKHGNHQPFETLGIDKQMLSIKDLLKQLRSNLKNLQWGYIAPKGANVNSSISTDTLTKEHYK